jgi:hypothetical protein
MCPHCLIGELEGLKDFSITRGTVEECPECKHRFVIDDFEAKLRDIGREGWNDKEEINTVTVDF